MPDDVIETTATTSNLPIVYNPSEARIAEVRGEFTELIERCRPVRCNRCLALTVKNQKPVPGCKDCKPAPIVLEDDDEGPKLALKKIVPLRTELDRCRKELKEEALRHGQRIDARARELKALITEFEDPIQDALEAIAEQRKARAEALVRQEEEAKAAAQKVIDDAAAAKRKEEDDARAAEAKKLADERAAFEREKAEAEERRQAEQRRHDAQKAELEAQAAKIREEADRLAREKQEAADKIQRDKEAAELKERLAKEAKEKAEKDAADREAKRIADEAEAARQKKILAEREKAEADALEAAKPDIEKIQQFGQKLDAFVAGYFPSVQAGSRSTQFLADLKTEMLEIAQRCKEFKFPKRGGK